MTDSLSPSGRPVSASKVEMTEIAFPNDANPLGNVMGGRVMQWIDICAAVAAGRHARTPVVTASVDQIDFHNPVPVGGVIVLLASVNFTGRTSMEVGVKVFQEERATGNRTHVVSAYLTFVSLDPATRQPRAVPPVLPESADEKRRFADGKRRRELRLAARQRG
ncbi:MAG: acyl-CoA thioesterase [Planctomycetes bacterium]|nr:acyl-CoA thioesterase [Planctomycetota bacterium]